MVLPIDEYAPAPEDEVVMTHARLAILRSCLQPKGFNGVEPPEQSAQDVAEDRPYGLWLVDRAKTHGFDMQPPSRTDDRTPPPGGWSDELDPAFNQAYDICAAEVKEQMLQVSSPTTSGQGSASTTIRMQARSLASEAEPWKAAHHEWQQCLRANGLTPPEQNDGWSSEEARALLETSESANTAQEGVRIAVIEATCNEQTQLTQKLGDIEAGYQATLIRQNEAALTEESKTHAAHLDAARAYLASHQ
ncbi:hypothetical protein NJC10_00050 [Micrococcus sp. M4NT]|uniref:hypothetical protein n=1 Tax=Micrococcus sp. M4NT TaxID=2957501 RepID=UPI0029A16232|nr:hypothetical protein [Micrococcus sp. M4NT]MDX2340074.1 hypothetical protein [Micrococcus sp. M4NT]